MMGSSKCDLYLENYTDRYKSGQTIVGYVQCTFVSPKEVHGILLKIKGEASTHWTETKSRYNGASKRSETRTVSYHGSHQLISEEIDLLNNSGREITISEGVHKYPFTYKLPEKLPSSYNHKRGKIEYKIKAVVKRPLLKFNYEAESPFVIVTPVNLNDHPTFQVPQTKSKAKKTSFCCWNKGTLSVTTIIPKAALIIGETLPLQIKVENLSQCNVEGIKVKVKKIMAFTATTPRHKTKTYSDTIYTDTYSGVGAHGEHNYNKTILIDNDTLVANSVDNNVIKCSYQLQITFVLSGLHRNIKFEIPFIIGHIPFAIAPPVVASPLNFGFAASSVGDQPPAYGFVQPQPSNSPNMMPRGIPMPHGMPMPPSYVKPIEGAFGGYQPAPVPGASAPMMPMPPTREPTAPPDESKNDDDFEYIDSGTNQDLPTYDQAISNLMKR